MAQNTVEKMRRLLPVPKFEATWEVVRAGLIWVFWGLAIGLSFVALLIFVYWFWSLSFGRASSGLVVILSTLITLLLLSPLRRGIQGLVDYLFFPDTAGFLDKVDAACRILPEINNRAELRRLLAEELPAQWQVESISLQGNPAPAGQDSLRLPLKMGSRSLGYLTIGPKFSGRTFGYEERLALEQFQEQISLVLSGIQLAEAQESAKRTDQMKSNFLTNISHELKTPLNAVINSTGLVADGELGPVTPEQQEYLNRAVNGSEYLTKLLTEILDFTKIETGQLTLQLEQVDLDEVIEDALSIARGLVQNKPVELKVEIGDDLPPVRADRMRVRQILLNLLSNAEKFTPKGIIWLKAWRELDEILVSIRDTGIGIARENLPLIFEDYQQVSIQGNTGLLGSHRRHLGTGLGMPLTRALVELHGGRIEVDSELGKGTVFIFTLPLSVPDAANRADPVTVAGRAQAGQVKANASQLKP